MALSEIKLAAILKEDHHFGAYEVADTLFYGSFYPYLERTWAAHQFSVEILGQSAPSAEHVVAEHWLEGRDVPFLPRTRVALILPEGRPPAPVTM